jgi:SAM-dependent methyltransferase
VLDVACGTGIVARTAADRVGPTGRVTGLDLNPGMLAVAQRLRPDLEWHQGDAENLPFADGSFDRVMCQFGLMFFPDRVAALREMGRVVAGDGLIAVAVWGSIDQSPPYAAMTESLTRHAGVRVADILRAPFVLSDLDHVRSLVEAAGLRILRAETRLGTVAYPSIDAFVRGEITASPLAPALREHGAAVYDGIVAETHDILRPYAGDNGVTFPIEAHVVVAERA